MARLRPYQAEALAAIDAAFITHRSVLAVLPTGTGKTVLFSKMAELWPQGRVLVLAHREELITQAASKVETATGEKPDIEMAEQRSTPGLWGGAKVVVGSVQTVCRRLDKFDAEEFGLIVVDEAHHCVPQNSTYWSIVKHFMEGNAKCKLLGVTATPDRSDELAMGQVFDHVAFEYPILSAINDGWLSPIEQQYVTVQGLDFSACRTTAGDLNGADLERAMSGEPELVHRVAASVVDLVADEPTLIFTVSVEHARMVCDVLCRYPGKKAEFVHGGTPKEDRRYTLRKFADGKFQFLVGCAIFTEGFDEPTIQNVVIARPTKSRALYAQMIGRGTRVLPGVVDGLDTAEERLSAIRTSAKPRCRVIDFVGNSGQHKLISSADILGGKFAPEAVQRAVEKAKAEGKPVRMAEAVEEAAEEIEKEQEAKRQRQEAARKEWEEQERKRREAYRAKADFTTEEIDPFDGTARKAARAGGFDRLKLPTEKMKHLLRKSGIDPTQMSFAEAAKAIADLRESWAGAKPTPKQAALLAKFGESADCNKDKARCLIDLIVQRGWQARDYRLTRDRWSLRRMEDGWAPVVNDPQEGKLPLSVRFKSEEACREFIGRCLEQPEVDRVAA